MQYTISWALARILNLGKGKTQANSQVVAPDHKADLQHCAQFFIFYLFLFILKIGASETLSDQPQ
jgi:hypothetical protein